MPAHVFFLLKISLKALYNEEKVWDAAVWSSDMHDFLVNFILSTWRYYINYN